MTNSMGTRQEQPPIIVIGKQESSWLKPLAIGVGVVGLGAGAYFLLKGPVGVPPGAVIKCHATFELVSGPGDYILQIFFGKVQIGAWFSHHWGDTKELHLVDVGKYEVDLEIAIPLGAKIGSYDAEALIRTPQMSQFDYLIKSVVNNAIRVK